MGLVSATRYLHHTHCVGICKFRSCRLSRVYTLVMEVLVFVVGQGMSLYWCQSQSLLLFSALVLRHLCHVFISGSISHYRTLRLVVDVNKCKNIYLSMYLKLRRITPTTWLALATILFMWWLKEVNLLSTTTPRSFSMTVSSSCTIVPSSAVIV